jgi:hypothetical protein
MTVGRIPVIEGGIQPTIFDAKADLLTATANDTPARLAVGTNGQVLTADSTAGTGLAWAAPAGGGKLLQLVSATTATSTNTNSATYADITGMSVTITPTSNTSKILIMWASNNESGISGYDDSVGYAFFQLLRGASALVTDQRANFSESSGTGGNGRTLLNAFGFNYYDSPASTSSLTYKFQGKRQTVGGTQFCYWGSSYQQTLIAMEIGA